MLDAHNHFTNIDSILCTSELLPQNIGTDYDYELVRSSEIGLDRRFISVIPIEKQISILKVLLLYAKDNGIPVTLHCVHETENLINVLREVKPQQRTVIWHGFNGSVETAEILNKMGVIISIGPRFSRNIKDLYDKINEVVLESDYEGNSQEEHDSIINGLYDKVSEITGISKETLSENSKNATKAFKNRIIVR